MGGKGGAGGDELQLLRPVKSLLLLQHTLLILPDVMLSWLCPTCTSAAEDLRFFHATESAAAEVPIMVRSIRQHSRQPKNNTCNESSRPLIAGVVILRALMEGG